MYYKKIAAAEGSYQDASGERFDICIARRIRSSVGVNVDYEEFTSLDTALAAWSMRLCESLPIAGDYEKTTQRVEF